MTPEEMKDRTKTFGLRVIRLVQSLPREQVGYSIGRQVLRSATSVGANYRAACRARSTADFIAKLKIVEEEADESLYWIEMLTESGLVRCDVVADLHREAEELLAIVVASIKTSRTKRHQNKNPHKPNTTPKINNRKS
ncbi:MAG: four helix bundle protein [Planctomycetes bacterium]|nr:four helix bundle protein [Planctomycetota bacterium]